MYKVQHSSEEVQIERRRIVRTERGSVRKKSMSVHSYRPSRLNILIFLLIHIFFKRIYDDLILQIFFIRRNPFFSSFIPLCLSPSLLVFLSLNLSLSLLHIHSLSQQLYGQITWVRSVFSCILCIVEYPSSPFRRYKGIEEKSREGKRNRVRRKVEEQGKEVKRRDEMDGKSREGQGKKKEGRSPFSFGTVYLNIFLCLHRAK